MKKNKRSLRTGASALGRGFEINKIGINLIRIRFVDMLKIKSVMEKVKGGKDKMDIEFYTMEDLQRIHQEYIKGDAIEFSLPYAIGKLQ